jgi:colanic acid/amylovoran biosynthesis glycosyltransferase
VSERPRLLFLASSFPYGKNDTFFAPEARELVRQGTDLVVVPVRPRGELTTENGGWTTIRRPLLDAQIAAAAAAELLRAPRQVLSALALLARSPRPSVLLRNLAAFPKALWCARLARLRRIDHIHAHWAGPPSTVALVASRLSGVPWSMTAHFADIAANNLLREKSESALFVRFIAQAMAQLARETEAGLDESRWVVLHLGIDVPPPHGGERPLHDPPRLLMSARFDPEKRHAVLVDAVAELHRRGVRVEARLAGTGRLLEDVRGRAEAAGVGDAVRFLGYVPNAEVLRYLEGGEVDFVVLPSDAEGIPVSLIEALAYEVPAAACDAGGVAELLGDGCGELAEPPDAAGVADAVERLLADESLRRGNVERGRARVEREFSATATARHLRELMKL